MLIAQHMIFIYTQGSMSSDLSSSSEDTCDQFQELMSEELSFSDVPSDGVPSDDEDVPEDSVPFLDFTTEVDVPSQKHVPTQILITSDSSSDSDDTPVIVTKKSKTGKGSKAKLARQDATLTHKPPHQQDYPQWPDEIAGSSTQKRVRNFVFTLNNYKTEEVGRLKEYAAACFAENPKFYLCFGFEVAKSGTKHLQGAVLLGKQVSMTALHKAPYPFARAACFVMRGTPRQASDYCKKDGNFFECGTCPDTGNAKGTKGARHDILGVVKRIKEGATDKMLLEEHPIETFKFLRNIRAVQSLCKPVRTEPLQVVLLYGPPGAGKTHAVHEFDPDVFRMPVSKDFWMDNYQQERNVLIDDFNGNLGLTYVLQVFDKYVIQIPNKGGFVWWAPDKLFITANTHPCNWYDYGSRQDSYKALARRFTKILIFTEPLYDDEGNPMYQKPVETPVHNFFHYQKVIGKHCLDISANRAPKALALTDATGHEVRTGEEL